MTWSDDFYAGTYQVKTSNLGASWVYYDKKFLEVVKQALKKVPLGQPRPLPGGTGTTIKFHRYLNLAVNLSNATLTEGVHPNATTFKMQQLSATIGEYGAFGQVSSLLNTTNIDRQTKGAVELFAEHGANILDLLCASEMCSNGGYPLRADWSVDTGATFKGTVDSADSTGMTDAALETNSDYGDANDDLNQSIMIITSGTAYGQARPVTDYVASGGVCTVSPAWDVTPVAADTYVVTSFDALASGDKATYESIKRSVTLLRVNRAKPSENGYYVCPASPYALEGLMDDTKWKDVMTYKDQTQGIFKGEVGKFMGVRFIEDTNPFTFPITTRGTAGTSYGPGANGANYSTSGEVEIMPIMGQNAYGVTNFSSDGVVSEPIVRIKTPGPNSTDQPLDRFSTVGWVVPAKYKALNPMFMVLHAIYNTAA